MKIKALILVAMVAGSLAAYGQSGKNIVANEPINEQQLNDFKWSVREASDAQGHSLADFSKNPNVQLQFKDGLLAVSGGCNNFSTSYQLDSQNSNISLGRVAGTMMSCAPELMAQDEAIEKVVNNTKLHIELTEKDDGELNLMMKNKQGDHLLLVAPASYYIRSRNSYGPPRIVFWEIRNAKPCKPAQGEEFCPVIREITYDDQGNKIEKDKWSPLWVRIMGWEFNPRERQVLRLKISEQKSSGFCGTALPAVTLDKIIEREIVDKIIEREIVE